jgi:AraC family transcriptional regulator
LQELKLTVSLTMDALSPFLRMRQNREWNNANVEVIEFQRLHGVARDLGSQRISLRAALEEHGGRVEARLRARVPTPGAYRGADHLSLIPAGEEAWGWSDHIEQFKCVVIHFADDFIDGITACESGLVKRVTPRLMFESKLLWGMASRLAAECLHPQPASRLYGDSLIAAMAVEMLRAQRGPEGRTRGGIAPHRLRRVLDYIDHALDQDMSMQALAQEASLSVPHFMRAFRQSTGHTPLRYVTQQRIERARRLLVASTLPLVDIAAACGFADQAHMNKCFRRLFGDTPGRLRRTHQ